MNKKLVPPVKEGEVMKVNVEAIGVKGDPLVKVGRFTIFVKNSKGIEVGAEIEIRVTQVLESYGFAEVV